MTVSLKSLHKTFPDGTEAVRGIDLDIEDGEFLTLLGPSGCGKTTTLRLIAGLEEPSQGSIAIGGRDVTWLDPGDRNVAMVFQSYALYPHMTALQNMTLNLTVAGLSKVEAEAKARETAKLLDIERLLDRKPAKLSGGERQRVALGRAMVRSPACYLMDEPLSNLDLKLREQMRTELKRLHHKYRVTTIYVTHDQAEALILSDRVVVLREGRIQQVADPVTIYERPANTFVADFIGSPGIDFLNGELAEGAATIGLMHPAALLAGGPVDLAERLPEAERAIAGHQFRADAETTPLEIEQHLAPGLFALAVAVGDGDQLLGSVIRGADDNQDALLLLFQAGAKIDAVDPEVDVALGR